MGLLFYSFWFAPMCDSPLQTVSTWIYLFNVCLLPCVRVRCGLYPHGLTVYSFGLFPCVSVRCGLYPHGLTYLMFVCYHV